MRAEYYQRQGGALVTLDWERLSGGAGWLGEYLANPNLTGQPALRRTDAGVDDADPGFVTGGSSSGWRVSAIGYGGRMTWTRNNDYQRPNHNWARWVPNLLAGRYEVFVYIPERNAGTRHADYWISHRDGYALRTIDQSVYFGEWVSLGTYTFRGTGDDYVGLSDVTHESYLSRTIGFDAVKWEPR